MITCFNDLKNAQNLTFDLDMEAHGSNRRKKQRKPCLIPVRYKINRQLYSGFILDLHEGGAFIETDRFFSVGVKILFQYLDPYSRRSALINGLIAWSSDAAIGVKFNYHLFTPF